MDELLEILEDIHPDVDYESETHLVTDGILKSFDIMMLVGDISDTFDVDIPVEKVVPENFESAALIFALIQSLQG